MEIRQKDAARDMENRKVLLRSSGSGEFGGGFTGTLPSSLTKMGRDVKENPESLTPEELREMIHQLSPEEKKQWSCYSDHEKQRLIFNVERKIVRKRRLYPSDTGSKKKTGNREETAKAYRREEPLKSSASQKGRTSGKIRQTGENLVGTYGKRTGEVSPKKENQKQKNQAEKRTAAPKIGAAVFKSPFSDTRSEKGDAPKEKQRKEFEKEENTRKREPGKRTEGQSAGKRRSGQDLNEKRREKRAKEEHAGYGKEFMSELEHTISADARKRQKISQAVKEEEIGQAELTYETGADALRQATTPVRAAAGRALNRIGKRIKNAAAGILKYLIGAGGLFLLLLLLILFAAALFGGLAGEEEESSGVLYTGNGEEIVEYAKEWIGITKYVWGYGRDFETDWQDYADCSSFVHGVYSHFGIQLGWDTYAMESDGIVLTGGLSEAAPGDLILYYTGSIAPNQSSHVAIYAGDGEVVHCSGGRSNYSVATAGRGVCMSTVEGAAAGRPYEVRRVISGSAAGTGGYKTDPTDYTEKELELIWAIVCQEDNGSYEGALAVISTAMNRVDSPAWSSLGSNALSQLTAPGQFCYSIDNYWRQWLNGNVPSYVIQAVSDCLTGGIRNHNYTSFRSYYTEGSEQIGGGNYYF